MAPKRKWWRGKPADKSKYDQHKIMRKVKQNREQEKADALSNAQAEIEHAQKDIEIERKLLKVEKAEARLAKTRATPRSQSPRPASKSK